MNVAWISGQAGRAIVETERDVCYTIADTDEPVVECSPRQLDVQLRTYSDVTVEPAGPFPFAAVRQSLARAIASDHARLCTIGAIDPSLDDALRQELSSELDHLLTDSSVQKSLVDRLHSVPVQADADLAGAIGHARSMSASRVVDLLVSLAADLPRINDAQHAWDAFADDEFREAHDAETARQWFTATGGFHQLVEALRLRSSAAFNRWMLGVVRSASGGWRSTPAKGLKTLLQVAGISGGSPESVPLELADFEHTELSAQPSRRKQLRRLAATEILARINSQIEALMRRLEMGDDATAERYRNQLVEFQQENSNPDQIAKSLCTIATRAVAIGATRFAEQSLWHALKICPDDAWTWSQLSALLRRAGRLSEANDAARVGELLGTGADSIAHVAEVLKAQGRYAESLAAYDEAIARFPDNSIVQNGRAEVLKAAGRYSEALRAYGAVCERFPDDVFAWNGRAEVLKTQGRYAEALIAYEQILRRFPDDVVAWHGRAEVLKAQGRYAEALVAYEETQQRFPDDVFAWNGRADVLKAEGRFDEALATYDRTRTRFPHNAIARNGRASVLVEMGRYDEAVACLPNGEPSDLQDWIALHIQAMARLKQGRTDDAIRLFQKGVDSAPYVSTKSYFRNALAVALIRQRQFRQAIDDLQTHVREMPAEQRTISTVLLAHAHAETSGKAEAERWLDESEAVVVPVVVDLRHALAQRYSLRLRGRIASAKRIERVDAVIEERELQMLGLLQAA